MMFQTLSPYYIYLQYFPFRPSACCTIPSISFYFAVPVQSFKPSSLNSSSSASSYYFRGLPLLLSPMTCTQRYLHGPISAYSFHVSYPLYSLCFYYIYYGWFCTLISPSPAYCPYISVHTN